ncbi:jasmonate O-methyltransferase-like [Neltuma alba]|uniref:jasmonate O-methyltransferase-like n=1 Tax=Neltuma alba TaxID=207710 RepID=UPI0010A4E845|nr:jasmonate O-methyltransferase-like [Prosopis alba]
MDPQKVFCMTGGSGSTSYAKNSSLQKKASDKVKHIIMDAVESVYLARSTPDSFRIADLGCSSGPNTLSFIKDIFVAIQGIIIHHNIPQPALSELRVYLNDLPTNDFNSIFKALPDFHRSLEEHRNNIIEFDPLVLIGAYPGSFYGRLFPSTSLHFVHSSHCLHWLSRVPAGLYDEQGRPVNKGSIYITEKSPPVVAEAYYKQFQEDFGLFLRSRSEELVVGGRMVLILLGRRGPEHVDRGNSLLWEILRRSFSVLVSEGEVEEEKVDWYDVHFYAACGEEIEEEVRKEGSFELERMEISEIETSGVGKASYGSILAKAIRAIQQSMISAHFGPSILDSLFDTYASLVDQEMAQQAINPINYVLLLRKL